MYMHMSAKRVGMNRSQARKLHSVNLLQLASVMAAKQRCVRLGEVDRVKIVMICIHRRCM